MNPSDDRLDRLIRAARAHQANEPVPPLSPWLEQRVIWALRENRDNTSQGWLNGGILFRYLVGAAVLAAVSLTLPFTLQGNPYLEMLDWTSPMTDLEKIP
jgi:hypothetical protein